MKNCKNCGKPLEDSERFCTVCGTDSAQTGEAHAEAGAEPEREFGASYKRILRYEIRALKIIGIVYLVLTIIFAAAAFVLAGSDSITVPAELTGLVTGGEAGLASYLFTCALYYCIISAVNIILSKKGENCLNAFESDIAPTVRHYGSIMMLFLCFMFNNIALVFHIINFVRTRSNAALIAKIIAGQRAKKGDFTQ